MLTIDASRVVMNVPSATSARTAHRPSSRRRFRAEGPRRVALGPRRPRERALARQLLDPLLLAIRARQRGEEGTPHAWPVTSADRPDRRLSQQAVRYPTSRALRRLEPAVSRTDHAAGSPPAWAREGCPLPQVS